MKKQKIYTQLADIHTMTDVIWMVDANFKVVASNTAYKTRMKHLSLGRESQGSHTLANDLHVITLYERALQGETFTEVEYSESPIEMWTETSYSKLQRGKDRFGVLCIARDITIRKKEEIRLKLLESVVTNATDAILISEIDSVQKSGPKIVFVNDALIKMTGYVKEELIGSSADMLYGKKSDKLQLDFMKACYEQLKPCEIDIINYKKNGEEFWIHLAMAPISDGRGPSVHFITIGRDVTERLRNIEAVKAQNKKLMAIARIQSHDVRGPLARIKGLLDLLTQQPTASEATELIEYLKISADELDNVVKRITAKSGEIQRFRPSQEQMKE